MNRFIPLGENILIKQKKEEERTKGGIIIPDAHKEKPSEGEVLEVGRGRLLENGTVIANEVKPGDKIMFYKNTGTEIKLDGQDFLILRGDHILGKIA